MRTPRQIKHALAENWEDAYVEEKIRDLVRVLNRKSLGIQTIAACEGHFKYPNSPYVFFQGSTETVALIAKRILLAQVRDEGLRYDWYIRGSFNKEFQLGFSLRSYTLEQVQQRNSCIQRFWLYLAQRRKIDNDLKLLALLLKELLDEVNDSGIVEIPDPYDKSNQCQHEHQKSHSSVFRRLSFFFYRNFSQGVGVSAIRAFFNFCVRRKRVGANGTGNKCCVHKETPKNTLKNRLSAKFTTLLLVVSLFIWLGFSHFANAAEWTFGNVQVEAVKSIYDGDTFRVDVSGWPSIIGKNMPIRVAGVDTPEIKGKCRSEKALAIQARDFAAQMLASGQPIVLTNIRRGKYFRIIADVWIGEHNLALVLIQNGLGRAYNGGRRSGWCS